VEHPLKNPTNLRDTKYANHRKDMKFYDILLKKSDNRFYDYDLYDERTRALKQTELGFIEGFRVTDEDQTNKISAEEEKRIFDEKLKVEFAQGYEQGFQEGVSLTSEKLAAPLAALNQILVEVVQLRAQSLKDAEEQVVTLSIAIAEKIIGHEIETRSLEIIKHTINSAMAGLVIDTSVTVLLNPIDHLLLNEAGEAYLRQLTEKEKLVFKEDDQIPQGGCLLRTSNVEVSHHLGEQFAALVEELRLNLQNAGPEEF